MDYKEKLISLINDKTLPIEQRKKLEEIYNNVVESEDERIRKELMSFLDTLFELGKNIVLDRYDKSDCARWIAWLEKQAKQKPTDKVEPKFKVGDWVIDNNIKTPFLITDTSNGKYDVVSIYGNDFVFSFNEVERFYHLWTIADAKDGDILSAYECIVVFKEIDGLNIKCHCTYHYLNNPSFYVNTLQNKTAFHPATKEQRDLLFEKMHEAGYMWDEEKKELRKMEQKPKWSEEDDAYKLFAISAVEDYYDEENPLLKDLVAWLESLKKRMEE